MRLKRHEPEALAKLYERFGNVIFTLLCSMVEDEETAAGLLEETFITVWNRIGEFEGSSFALAVWLLAIARARALSRAESVNGLSQTPCIEPKLFNGLPFGRDQLIDLRNIHEAWSALGEKRRRAIDLALREGASSVQLAAELGEPIAEVMSDLKATLGCLHSLPVETSGPQIGEEESQQTDSGQE